MGNGDGTVVEDPLLAVRDFSAGYGRDVDIVRTVNLSIERGRALVVIGPNGAGKSTLLKAVLALVPRVNGEVVFRGNPIVGLSPGKIVRLGIGYVPQGHQVFPQMTVRENLEMGCYWMGKAEAAAAVELVLDSMPQLRTIHHKLAGLLSGGQQQLVSIGRALTHNPPLLLIDEPSAGLSPANTALVFEMLHELRDRGVAMMLVEQNAVAALEFGDRGLVLDMGRVRFSDNASALLTNADVRASYLGALN